MQHTADQCAKCRAVLGVGRFCTNCGHPRGAPVLDDLEVAADDADDWRTGTAERPAVPPEPVEPLPAHEQAPAPRYPLWADEAEPVEETRVDMPAVAPAPTGGSHRADSPERRRKATWVPWVVGLGALTLVAALGIALLLTGDDEGDTTATAPASQSASPDGESSDDPSPSADPSDDQSEEPDDEGGEPRNLARFATATVPDTAPASRDNSGNAVRYEARQMLDGVAETTWRMPGDGSGETITFELDSPATLSRLGLINGYAKTGRDGGTTFDWYAGNRRVLVVEWVVDGTTIRQELEETRDLQVVDIDQVTAQTVDLRLVEVSPPGRGRASRNYTAVSEIALVGVPA